MQIFPRGFIFIGRADGSRPRGSILIMVLWAVSLLSAFAVIIGAQVRQKLTAAYRLDERGKLYYLCDAGVKKAAAFFRREQQGKAYDALNDLWSVNPGEFQDIAVGDGISAVSYDTADAVTGEVFPRYGMTDEERKINIHKADRPQMKILFEIVSGLDETDAQDLAASIIDWRDADSESQLAGGGAESGYYHNLPEPYDAKNAPCAIIEELLLVKGMTREMFDKLKDYITMYGDGKININTASAQVLRALNLTRDMVDQILALRRGHDGQDGTADDAPFTDSGSIVPRLTQMSSYSASDLALLTDVVNSRITVKSAHFMVRSSARVRKSSAQVVCVINREGQVLSWSES